ncbi:unnamed protein product [Alopecurus aequalis]
MSSSSCDNPDYRVHTSDLPRQADAAAFVSFLRTQEEVDGVCRKYSVPGEQYTASPACDLRVNSPPPSGAVCVYAHALEAGMRVPLHRFYSEALAHFGIAPTQLVPNGWRIVAGFLVLCHSDGVPPSLAVFRHFFQLSVINHKRKGWYFFRSKDVSGLSFAGLPHCIKDWKHGFFFLSSTTQWPCPVEWGEPSKSSFMEPVLTGEEKEWATQLRRAHGANPVDLTTYLCHSRLAAAMKSPVSPPPSCTRTSNTSARCKGMDPSVYGTMKTMLAEKAAAVHAPPASATKVKTEPGSAPLCGKKRRLDEAIGEDGPPSSVLPNTRPAAHGCTVPPPGLPRTPQHFASGHARESTDWQTARRLLQGAVLPPQERVFAANRPSDVVASCYLAILQAANYASFSLGHALELEEKLGERDAEIATLRKELEETRDGAPARRGEAGAEERPGDGGVAGAPRIGGARPAALERYRRWKDSRGTARRT